jgi:hypothetical protein
MVLVKLVKKLKSQLEVKWFLAIFIVLIITMLILSRIISIALTNLYQIIAESSSQNVAIQLSSLMSASGAATYGIDIEYIASKDIVYDVLDQFARKIEVWPKYSQPFIVKGSFKSKYCTNFQEPFEFKDVNVFFIQKKEGNYKISAWRFSK